MTITVQQLGHAGDGNLSNINHLTLTTTAAVAAGDLVLVFAAIASNKTLTISDSGGNAWTAGLKVPAIGLLQPFWTVASAAMPAGATITIAFPATVCITMSARSVSGVSGLDMQGAGTSGNGTAPSIATGVLSQAGEIVFGFLNGISAYRDGYTEAAGFTSEPEAAIGNVDMHSAYQIVSGTGPVTYAPVLGKPRSYAANVLAFKG